MKAAKRLLENIKPDTYRLNLDLDMSAFTYQLNETVSFELLKASSLLELHCNGPKIARADLKNVSNQIKVLKISYNESEGTVELALSATLSAGTYQLDLEIEGEIQSSLHGFYSSHYALDGKTYSLATTQFEATHARECFACIDEPAAKAVFDITITAPKDLAVVSNGQLMRKTERSGQATHHFEPTPIMSTYLVAFIIGELEYLEGKTKDDTLVRVYATPGKRDHGAFALDTAIRSLEFFSEYFGIAYPLPKLDMLAIPDFAAGAMENWGAITYRETALLIDPKNSAQTSRERVAVVVTHELAHQWFGNLVTMSWWTDLWLNEGFASWIEYLACDKLFPEWKFWEKFVADAYAGARQTDSLATTHAIEIEVKHPAEITEIFDAISYDKGASIIRMLHDYLGDDDFRGGLSQYLKKYQYANTTTADLWRELELFSKKPVSKVMSAWTKQPGYPIVSFDIAKNQLSQERFSTAQVPTATWPLPIEVMTAKGTQKRPGLLEESSERLDLKLAPWYKPNPSQSAFYITNYSPDDLTNLMPKAAGLSSIDRWGILADCHALAQVGRLSAKSLLPLLARYRHDENYVVWMAIIKVIDDLLLLSNDSNQAALDQFTIWLVQPTMDRLGTEAKSAENNFDSLLRPEIMLVAGRAGNTTVVKAAQTQFGQFLVTGELDPNLRGTIYRLCGQFGKAGDYEKLKQLFLVAPSQEEARRLFFGMTKTPDSALIKDALAMTMSDKVRLQDSVVFLGSLLINPVARDQTWEDIKQNWAILVDRYDGGGHMLGYVPRYLAMAYADDAVASDIESFFKDNATAEMTRSVAQSLERIRSQAAWKKRDQAAIAEFLKTPRKI